MGGSSSLMKLAELLLLGDVAACGGANEIWTVQGSQVRGMQRLEWMESDRRTDTGRRCATTRLAPSCTCADTTTGSASPSS